MTQHKLQSYGTKGLIITPMAVNDIEVLSLDIQERQKNLFKRLQDMGTDLPMYGYNLLSAAAINRDNNKIAWTAISEERIECCAGMTEISEGVYEAWALFSSSFKKYSISFARAMKSEVNNLDFIRLQAYVEKDFTDAHRFIKFLGFKKETELKHYYGKDNHAVIYSIIRE